MLVDARIVELTQSFYAWELRGRGWARYPQPVVLEPAFRPFLSHELPRPPAYDDARRPTLLSSLAGLVKGERPEETQSLREIEEPDPILDPRSPEKVELAEFVVALPQDSRVSSGAVVSWLRSLSTISGPASFELLGGGGRVEVRLAIGNADVSQALGQLRAVLPEAVVLGARDSLIERWVQNDGGVFSAVEFGLANEFMVPLARFGPSEEPLLPLVAALADVGNDELGLVQVLFEETREPWEDSLLRSVVTPSGKPFFADAPEITAAAKEKVSTPLYAVCLRVAGVGRDGDSATAVVSRLAAGLSHFGNPRANELMPLPTDAFEILESDLLRRTTHRSGMLLSTEELASLVHFPGAGVRVPELWRASEKTKAAPPEVRGSGCFIGRNEHHREENEVRLSVDAKTKHVHVVGSSGTGKSTLLVRMILEDIEQGHGVGVLDPHGDLIAEVASRLPQERFTDVVFFDPSEDQTAIGWNILGAQSETEKDLLASDLVGVFRRLSTSWGDQMTAVLANAILVFLESSCGGTLLELRKFLVDEAFRREVLATVDDEYVGSFWETEFPLLIGRKPQAPILTRLDMFLRSKLIRRIVTVREPKLDFREVTDRGLIFLGKLATGAIGEDNAALLGSLLVSKFHQVTIAREAQAVEDRRPFFLYIDEFHHVATPSMASLFSGARKYRLGLTVAHQDLFQLHKNVPEVERSLLANAYTRVCFRAGEADARDLAKGFSFFEPEDLMGLGLGEAVCRVGGRGADFNLRTEKLPGVERDEARARLTALRQMTAERWRGGADETVSPPSREEAPKPPPKPATSQPAAKPPASAASEPTSAAEPETSEAPQPQLDKEALDYLELIANEPFLSVRERNDQLGLSAWKGNQIKKTILDANLVREVPVNPGGRGQRFKLFEFTAAGRDVLAEYGIESPTGYGRGGVAHQWWVNTIAEWLGEQGLSPVVEDDSSGARVDLAFSVSRKKVAVEVEMAEGHALENIRKDLEAGYHFVVSLLDDSASFKRIQEGLESETGDLPSNVRVGALQDYAELLTPPLIPHPPPSLRRPKQDKEPRRRSRRRRRAAAPSAGSSPLMEPGALTTPMAADYVGLSPATLETMRVRGGGPVFVKLGARVVYQREDLDKWLEERKRKSTSDPGH